MIVNLEARDFLDFVTLWHVGNCNCGIPPQSLLFPITDIIFTFLKTPPVGTSPSILLNEMFKYFKNESFSRPFGINPDKLFYETSKCSRPFNEPIDEGMFPLKEFSCKPRYTKLKQFPIVVGISPEKLFLETSSESIFFKPSTSTGKLPLNELWDKLSKSDKEKNLKNLLGYDSTKVIL